jgi:hypothetical protein
MTIPFDFRETLQMNFVHCYGLCILCTSSFKLSFASVSWTGRHFRPHELMVALTPEADPLLLLRLSHIAHKYQFHSIESWALRALTAFYNRPLAPPPDLATLLQITELAVRCDQHTLLEISVSRWKRSIGERRHLAVALGVAERLNLRKLSSLAYYTLMLEGRERWEADPLITRTQRIRLLSGSYNLGRVCEELPSAPPIFEHHSGCTSRTRRRCHQSWARLWRSITENMTDQLLSLQHVDVIGRVMLAESVIKALVTHEIPSIGLIDSLGVGCGNNALVATGEKLKDLQENLVDFFEDVE